LCRGPFESTAISAKPQRWYQPRLREFICRREKNQFQVEVEEPDFRQSETERLHVSRSRKIPKGYKATVPFGLIIQTFLEETANSKLLGVVSI